MVGDIPVTADQPCPHRCPPLVRRWDLVCTGAPSDELTGRDGERYSQVIFLETRDAVASQLLRVQAL
jgi:hypothetical protein